MPGEQPCAEHRYVFLRTFGRETTWHHFVVVDLYFCEKCLLYKEVEREPEERKRW